MIGKQYHVAVCGNDVNEGTLEQPFRTITKAAIVAMAGDTVIVHQGIYREWVNPQNGGLDQYHRIIYKVADGERVVIKGSEEVTDWKQVDHGLWKIEISNTVFQGYNPYKELLTGDWLIDPKNAQLHLGDVYLNGRSLYEAQSVEEVRNPMKREVGYNPPWTKKEELIPNPEDTVYQWYAQVEEEYTTIYANFQAYNPNEEVTEINVRKCCFYPTQTHINYITVSGFEMAHAACPWTPPTADQPAMLGVNWSKGWIIENNILHDAKCSAISIGKESSTGHNLYSRTRKKPGYQYQMESVFRALQIGWSKETIGSHIIRNNTIYDCGQNGIVGHMGCVFSEIYGNHIYNIAQKYEFFGHEIAGIKLHAAIDVIIRNNNIHHTSLGTWLDWQAQGVRVSQNLYYHNHRDFMIEVTHGPHLVDNNIFASDYNFENVAQGGAYIHNLYCGTTRRVDCLDRATPYHFPHTTEVAGVAVVYGGDDRYYQNIFVGGKPEYIITSKSGTIAYEDFTESPEAYLEIIKSRPEDDLSRYQIVRQPACINHNCYYKDASPVTREADNYCSSLDPKVTIVTEGKNTYLEMVVDEGMFSLDSEIYNTEKLGSVRIVEENFENPDGTPITFNQDFLGQMRGEKPVVGPINQLKIGYNRIKIWSAL